MSEELSREIFGLCHVRILEKSDDVTRSPKIKKIGLDLELYTERDNLRLVIQCGKGTASQGPGPRTSV